MCKTVGKWLILWEEEEKEYFFRLHPVMGTELGTWVLAYARHVL